MKTLKKLRVLCACFVSFVTSSVTQQVHALTPSGDNHGSYITHDGNDQLTFHWEGRTGWTYFIQHSENLADWDYSGYLAPGEGNPIEFGVAMSSPDPFFLRLKLSDILTDDAFNSDFDGDGLSNSTELQFGADPLSFIDSNYNNLPDDLEALWASVENSWKDAFVNDPQKAIYDPDNTVSSIDDVSPVEDYDGDGRSNLEEYLDGTDPIDYYNGDLPVIYIIGGNHQKSLDGDILKDPLVVLVVDATGQPLDNAPVVFSINTLEGSLESSPTGTNNKQSIVARTSPDGRNTGIGGPIYVRIQSASATVTANANSVSAPFSVGTVASVSASSPADLDSVTVTMNPDGSALYEWTGDTSTAHAIQLFHTNADGLWIKVGVAEAGTTSMTIPSDVMDNL